MRQAAQVSGVATGYGRYLDAIDQAIAKAQSEGEFKGSASPLCMRSAIAGIVEGGVREQVLASRTNFPASFNTDDYTQVVARFLRTLANGVGCGQQAALHV
jgi:hypothetical protein